MGFLFFSLSLNSCLKTLYPFFTEKDVVFKPEMTGNYSYMNGKKKGYILFETINQKRSAELYPGIRKIADKGYLVTWTDSSGIATSKNFVFLAKIGKCLYMDFYPAEMEDQNKFDEFYRDQFTKLHSCYKVEISNQNSFSMKRLNGDFVKELIDKNQIRMSHEYIDDNIYGKRCITASTEELQEFLIKFSDNPKAYDEDCYCTRLVNY